MITKSIADPKHPDERYARGLIRSAKKSVSCLLLTNICCMARGWRQSSGLILAWFYFIFFSTRTKRMQLVLSNPNKCCIIRNYENDTWVCVSLPARLVQPKNVIAFKRGRKKRPPAYTEVTFDYVVFHNGTKWGTSPESFSRKVSHRSLGEFSCSGHHSLWPLSIPLRLAISKEQQWLDSSYLWACCQYGQHAEHNFRSSLCCTNFVSDYFRESFMGVRLMLNTSANPQKWLIHYTWK